MVTNSIQESLSSNDRYKLFVLPSEGKAVESIVSDLENFGVPALDLGSAIASFISSSVNYAYLSIETFDFTKKLIEAQKRKPTGSKIEVLALYNLGILFEPSLDLNPKMLLKEFSKSSVLILIWEDYIEDEGVLKYSLQADNYNLNFSEVPLKRISI
jgi:hypothetical protein